MYKIIYLLTELNKNLYNMSVEYIQNTVNYQDLKDIKLLFRI